MSSKIALLVFPGFQILDLAVVSVFELANDAQDARPYSVEVVSCTGGLVISSAGVKVETQPLGRRQFDTLIIAGATEVAEAEPGLVEALRRAARRTRRMASVCTGAFFLAEAGLLNGRRVTTHWAQARHLQQAFPEVILEDDKIFVQDGPIWTSAGMTACIDLALALVDADLGGEVAKRVSRTLVIHYRRTGGQSQFSMLSKLEPHSDRIRLALDFARENLRKSLSVEELAEQVNWSPRHFSRAFQIQMGISPAKAIEKLRLEAARSLIEEGETSIARVADATGFGEEERMRRAFLRVYGKPPQTMVREVRLRAHFSLVDA